MMATADFIRPDSDIAREFWERGRSDRCPVYDMHGHMGNFGPIYMPRSDTDAMIAAMDRAGVKMLCFSHHAALLNPLIGNAPAIEAARRYPDRLRVYLLVNPNYPANTAADLEAYNDRRDVCVGFKFLADYHNGAIDGEGYQPALEFADANELLVLTHTWGGSEYDGHRQVRAVAEKYPRVRLLLGHSLHGAWERAVELANEFPNVYLELTAVNDDRGIIAMFCEKAGSEKLIYGTDLPWFSQHYNIGWVLSEDITENDLHNIFHRNAEGLLGIR